MSSDIMYVALPHGAMVGLQCVIMVHVFTEHTHLFVILHISEHSKHGC